MVLFDIVYLLVLVLSVPLWARMLFKREYRRILKHRFSPAIEPAARKRIWIHAVSVGEVKSLKSLIERLRQEYDQEIVLSVTTPSGFEFARMEYQDIEVINAPVDLSFTIKSFLRRINPGVLILNELEIWPNWILLTSRAKIPILLVNGRISEQAYRRYRFFRAFTRGLLSRLDLFLVQAEVYRERFLQLHIPAHKIMVCGSIKAETAFDAAACLPVDREIFKHLRIEKNKKRILCLASTHESDERAAAPLLNELCRSFSVILVPRHIDRVAEIEMLLQDHGVKYVRWSDSKKIDFDEEVLLFDSMGYLFNILKISDLVFMGGTFDKRIGGHNLYEPAVLGKMIVGGPFYNNFPDIGRELEERGAYKKVNGPAELKGFLLDSENIDLEKIAVQAQEAVSKRKGSIACILKQIRGLID